MCLCVCVCELLLFPASLFVVWIKTWKRSWIWAWLFSRSAAVSPGRWLASSCCDWSVAATCVMFTDSLSDAEMQEDKVKSKHVWTVCVRATRTDGQWCGFSLQTVWPPALFPAGNTSACFHHLRDKDQTWTSSTPSSRRLFFIHFKQTLSYREKRRRGEERIKADLSHETRDETLFVLKSIKTKHSKEFITPISKINKWKIQTWWNKIWTLVFFLHLLLISFLVYD